MPTYNIKKTTVERAKVVAENEEKAKVLFEFTPYLVEEYKRDVAKVEVEEVEIKVCPTCKLEVSLDKCFIDYHGIAYCPDCGHIELEDKEV